MFETLISERRGERRLAHPAISFALHAGAIGLVMTVARPNPTVVTRDPVTPLPVWFPEAPHPAPIPPVSSPVLPGPVCQCRSNPTVPPALPVPGQVPIGQPTIPGLPQWPSPGTGGIQPVDSVISEIVAEADLSDAPEVMHLPAPIYPPVLRSAGVEGAVRVRYVVDLHGHVEPGSIVVVSSDHPVMAESVRQALIQAIFRPGRVRGKTVRSLVQQTFRFSLMSL